ncbi:DUF397 domain-containing protein [Kitasatospora sp. NBC_01250]|uniref:DUF397 domain-containing protein n=1 Tax=unclassified Kitasatospora TaxID=2633591 RepID=UPI002E115FB5|nr:MULTISPECIES: DUF397 domain-containing protein [unclassified Kitasatospora]WSJ67383.1 DUF397 domain-containing protein [Kitasatospora sp. NBC_01302]
MTTPDLSGAAWFKSTHSNNGGNCVEVAANVPDTVPVRDSKNPAGPALIFPTRAFASFVAGVKNGQFDNS